MKQKLHKFNVRKLPQLKRCKRKRSLVLQSESQVHQKILFMFHQSEQDLHNTYDHLLC
jgi:hypothetical protein